MRPKAADTSDIRLITKLHHVSEDEPDKADDEQSPAKAFRSLSLEFQGGRPERNTLPKKQRVDRSAIKRFAGYLPPMNGPFAQKDRC
ncbi:hypothetical protein [Bradyrhizobium sp.]|uniref:hypothetical protein n=1 Tax=Bradyrhizobium sp. TaxID=376 RepID=UPI003C3B464F